MKGKTLRIIPLGGLGEVGKNMMVYEFENDIIIVDSGLMFPDNDMIGIDYIVPDIEYLRSKRNHVQAIIVTHGHEDHIGSMHRLLAEINAPIYATQLTRGLLEAKLARNGLSSQVDIRTVQPTSVVQINHFRLEFFHVCHSVPDAVGLGIQTPAGLVVHTGDYKFDQTPVDGWPTDFSKLAEFSRRGVMALLADSTNAERSGWTPSEKVIDAALEQVFLKAKGRIIIASFASLIARMQQVVNAAQNHGRKLAFVGTSMVDNVKVARKLGYLELPENLLVPIEQAMNLPDKDVVVMCTGSQGEPTSIMGRLSTGSYRGFDLRLGDTVVLSSHPIPGNEENVFRTINRLFERGANVLYEAVSPVHVSGHASQEEMKLLLNLVRPRYVIPIHGELRHLKRHAWLAQEVGIPEENIAVVENGQVIEFNEGKMTLGERVPVGALYIDDSGSGDVGLEIMREREALAREGVVLVQLVIDRQGKLVVAPHVACRGFVANGEMANLMDQIRRRATEAVARSKDNLQKDVEQVVRSFLGSEMHRRPMVLVMVSEVDG
jgi:ribonuclease J